MYPPDFLKTRLPVVGHAAVGGVEAAERERGHYISAGSAADDFSDGEGDFSGGVHVAGAEAVLKGSGDLGSPLVF